MKTTVFLLVMHALNVTLNAQYQIASQMGSGQNMTIKTRSSQGYVIKTDGARLDGEIQLKIVNNDTTEIELKSFSGTKTMFARLDLSTFGLKSNAGGSTKIGDLVPGHVVFNDGNKVTGQVAFTRGFYVGDFKKHTWGFYLKTSETDEPKYYGPEDGVDYVAITDKDGDKKYAPIENYFVDYDELLQSLNNSKAKDKANNLQNGFVVFKDGKKVEGRLARHKSSKFMFVGADNKLNSFYAKDETISYVIQKIDGVERKYIGLMGNMKAFSGPTPEWVEVFQHSGTFSYYKNPAPTNKKEGMTNFVKGTINTGVQVAANEAGKEAGEQQMEKDIKEGDKNLYKVAEDATTTKDKTQADVQNAVQVGDEGGIYFDEWIVVNNTTDEKIVMYKKNDEETGTALLKKCSASTSLDKSEWKKLTNIDNIDMLVTYLNANKCN